MGCYDDFEAADAFVLWGSNMAEMHPILWTRVTDRRLGHPHVRCAVLSTFTHRTLDLADIPIVFKPRNGPGDPQLHRQPHHPDRPRQPGVRRKHTNFMQRRDRHRLRAAARPSAGEARPRTRPTPARSEPIDFDALSAVRRRLHAGEGVRAVRRSSAASWRSWRSSTPTPSVKVMSLWTMGFNQHVRGVWANQMVYNLHLLTGKISEPGNSPFSLTGQPSACGTAREVGTFAHRLPADMVVTNPEHRKHAEEIWRLPHGLLPDKPGYHAVQQDRMLKDGKLNFYWIQVNNNLQAAPNSRQETYPGYRNPDNFIVVSDAYPTVTAMAADLDPAGRDVGREGRRLRQRRAAHPCLAPAGQCTRRGALRPLAAHGVLQALHHRRGLAGGDLRRQSRIPRQDAVRRAVPQRQCRQIPGSAISMPTTTTTKRGNSASICRRACSRNMPRFGRGHGHDLAPYDRYHEERGLRWPVVDGKETKWRYREGYDPYVKPGEGVRVLWQARRQGGDPCGALRAAGGSRQTRNTICGW